MSPSKKKNTKDKTNEAALSISFVNLGNFIHIGMKIYKIIFIIFLSHQSASYSSGTYNISNRDI